MNMKDILKQPLVQKSLIFAYKIHENHKHRSGKDYITHPLEVAKILSGFQGHDEEIIAAGLLHDVTIENAVSLAQLEQKFGENIKNLVDGANKLAKIYYKNAAKLERIDALKKVFLAMLQDPRIILIKLADRLHDMKTLKYMPKEEKNLIAAETLNIYGPIANFIGLREWAWELEELSFKTLYPKEYREISGAFKNVLKNIVGYVDQISNSLIKLTNNQIKFSIQAIKKHNYHIYRTRERKRDEFDCVKDTSAIKIITKTTDDCYKLFGLIHSLYKSKPSSIKDYIAIPKINGYQGLHAAIFSPEGKMLHIQIQTEAMAKQRVIFGDNKLKQNLAQLYELMIDLEKIREARDIKV